jgi:hypothetical protein
MFAYQGRFSNNGNCIIISVVFMDVPVIEVDPFSVMLLAAPLTILTLLAKAFRTTLLAKLMVFFLYLKIFYIITKI